ncbi:hypothetical protein PIROE2DRAFT_8580 [Piromyces sp. E2]|nr:hypothetical protein PIROE2DRAFT_8580 [Piromyces sp. E2]|eukprot:OUM64588.1 hypothetical protein PIROE2DRAFT_8580 [Piromyces sp. E2]
MGLKKKNTKKKSNDDDDNSDVSTRSMENLKTKEKIELMKFLNEQLTQPLEGEEDNSEEEEGEEFNNNLFNGMNNTEKKADAAAPGKEGDPNNKSNPTETSVIYSKRFDEETCYFDLKKKAHAFPMKWYESHKPHNDYQQIPRTTKNIDLNAENDRNANFALFNRQNLNKSKWEKMDRNMQAKYYIYENPLPDIQNFVMNTKKRNQQYERNIREQIKLVYGKEPTPSELQQIIEKQRQESIEASQKANQRIKDQFLWQLDTRNSDLQHLLEGQQTALDAIRLKEYLLLKPIPIRYHLKISDKDRRRIGNILSNRY